jgi:Tfp pilus assembly protein FimT
MLDSHKLIPRQQGLSLIESCISCLVAAILLSTAVPAMKRLLQTQRLQGLSQTLVTDLQQARSEAVQNGHAVQFHFSRHADGSCYIVHTAPHGDCRCSDAGEAICNDPTTLLKSAWLPQPRGITLRSNASDITFDARQGTISPVASIDIAATDGPTIRHVISVLGRVRSCTPADAVGRLPRC